MVVVVLPLMIRLATLFITAISVGYEKAGSTISKVVVQYLLALALARRRICTQSPNKYTDESSK
ncbi:hypothetical protein Scep_023668 [Stephania cephalantha]|uniref:Uncharacterized protein n=1 Tax=Stephania cephalantha TaxID=152367 RepID=A0AAP0F288_9MAGN